jgi:hypothetical protein
MPFRTSRGSRQGLPRRSFRTRSRGKSGATARHWFSVRSTRSVDQIPQPLSIPNEKPIELRTLGWWVYEMRSSSNALCGRNQDGHDSEWVGLSRDSDRGKCRPA